MTLTVPSTGQPWGTSNTTIWRTGAVRRGGRAVVFMRDYFGLSTSLSPAGFSPYSADFNLRQDLAALVLNPNDNGVIMPNPITPNQGWYPVGLIDPKGIDITPDLKVDKLEGLQTLSTVRSDLQNKSKMVSFNGFESTPIIDVLEYNLPFSELQDDGSLNYGVGEQVDNTLVQRQLLIIRADARDGLIEYTTQGFGCVELSKINKRTLDKKTVDSFDVAWDVVVDPYFVDLKGRPITDYKWRGGPGWNASGGSPVFSSAAPVALAVTGLKATITLAEPVDEDPETVQYTVIQQVGGAGAYTASTLATGTNPAGVGTGTLVATVTGLTAVTSYKFEVIATSSDGSITTSSPSNSITSTAD
jgi:hypothetical protein